MLDSKLQAYICDYLRQSLSIFYQGSMLRPFSSKQLTDFICDASCFALSLNRPSAQGVMYSLAHIRYRKAFFNNLDREDRLSVFDRKVKYLGMHDLFLSVFEKEGLKQYSLRNVLDIGAGHTVYLLEFSHGSYVIKQEMLKTQCFMSKLLVDLTWPSLKSFHISNSFGSWEISEYAGENVLESYLIADPSRLTDSLIQDLAKHAALGDCIGRGDRHFQNYIYRDFNLYPLDLSYLFSDNHEQWVHSYTKAGMGEMGILQLFLDDEASFFSNMRLFFKSYIKTFDLLRSNQTILLNRIESFFDDAVQKKEYLAFADLRLHHDDYLLNQCKQYFVGFRTFIERILYKKLLQSLVSDGLNLLDHDPVLSMYYHADFNRFSAFFLLDEFNRGYLLSYIDELLMKRSKSFQPLKAVYLSILEPLKSGEINDFIV